MRMVDLDVQAADAKAHDKMIDELTSQITIAGTDRALAATADAEVVAVPKFTGSPEQLWRIDQLTDGTYRIMPKSVPGSKEPFVLTAVAHSTPHGDRAERRDGEASTSQHAPHAVASACSAAGPVRPVAATFGRTTVART